MSYFFRQQQMRKQPVEKALLDRALNRAAEFAATASRIWDESKITRGKTTERSTPGSFAPQGQARDPLTGRRWSPEAQSVLKETQQVLYRKLYEGDLKTRPQAEKYAQERMAKWMGPGYERQVSTMVHRIWNEFVKNGQHRYIGPSILTENWAVKCDIEL